MATKFEYLNVAVDQRNYPKMDINAMYERVFDELSLQQSKRDQLITIYLAAFAFIVPALLNAENINLTVCGCIFFGLGIIGYLFSLIIIRYRKYKETYWICCRTLSVMMTLDEEQWTKPNIYSIYFRCMLKKVKDYVYYIDVSDDKKFKTLQFVKDNIFSGETLYLVINSIISGSVFGLGLGMLVPLGFWFKLGIGIAGGAALCSLGIWKYFETLIKFYKVCADESDESFNKTFRDAWFLHFFLN